MKRMVKNGDLIDVEPDGTITVAGKPIGGGGGLSDVIETDGTTTTVHSILNVDGKINAPNGVSTLNTVNIKQVQSCESIVFKDAYSVTYDKNNKAIKLYNYNFIPKISLSANTSNILLSYICDISLEGKTGNFQFKANNKDAIFSGFRSRIPEPPASVGTYRLVATVSSTGDLTFTWENN